VRGKAAFVDLLFPNFKKLWPVLCASMIWFSSFVTQAASATDPFDATDRAHWSFQKITRPEPPAIKNSPLVSNPIDAFVLAQLEAKHLQPMPPTDKITLLRRASLDLVGLPPTPEEVDAFLADHSENAFEEVVDRLLASPRYGERQALFWLDLVRFAETDGFKADDVTRHFHA